MAFQLGIRGVLGLVMMVIIAVAGLAVLGEMKTTFTAGSAEYNATEKGVEGVSTILGFILLFVGGSEVAVGLLSSYLGRSETTP